MRNTKTSISTFPHGYDQKVNEFFYSYTSIKTREHYDEQSSRNKSRTVQNMLRKMNVTAGQKDVQLLSLASNYGVRTERHRALPTAGGNSNLNFVRSTLANCDFSPIKKGNTDSKF